MWDLILVFQLNKFNSQPKIVVNVHEKIDRFKALAEAKNELKCKTYVQISN